MNELSPIDKNVSALHYDTKVNINNDQNYQKDNSNTIFDFRKITWRIQPSFPRRQFKSKIRNFFTSLY